MKTNTILLTMALLGSLLSASAAEQSGGSYEAGLNGPINVHKGRPYAPYANRGFPTEVYFGDMAGVSLTSRAGLAQAYEKGVPMGGDLPALPEGKAPTIVVHALKEADGANLDRIQIIKGWVSKTGEPQHKIFDVALSGGRKPGPNGKIPAVGNTVNEKTATYSNSIGAPELMTAWTDPEFDPSLPALYYARVIEIPTPRWSTYDAVRNNLKRPEDVPVSIQERAWTSPIWYTP